MSTLLLYSAGIVFMTALLAVELGIIYLCGRLIVSMWRN